VLSLRRYRWLCILGGEVAYALCLSGGLLPIRSSKGVELHHALFETLPGFVWINPQSVILGAVYVLLFSWVFGTYMVWMHNSSLVDTEVKSIGSLPTRNTDVNELDEAGTGAYKVK
jgi:hypothetical protein